MHLCCLFSLAFYRWIFDISKENEERKTIGIFKLLDQRGGVAGFVHSFVAFLVDKEVALPQWDFLLAGRWELLADWLNFANVSFRINLNST